MQLFINYIFSYLMISVVLFQCHEGHQCPVSGHVHAQWVVHASQCHFDSVISFPIPCPPCSVFIQCVSCFTCFWYIQQVSRMKPLHKKSPVNVNGQLFISYQYICTFFSYSVVIPPQTWKCRLLLWFPRLTSLLHFQTLLTVDPGMPAYFSSLQ